MSEKRKDYFSGGENIPQVCIVERHGVSAHLLGGIHRLTSSRKRYQPSKKAQGKFIAESIRKQYTEQFQSNNQNNPIDCTSGTFSLS
jgi:hypothetical protein